MLSSSISFIGHRGIVASISEPSSTDRTCEPTVFQKYVIILFTANSQMPPMWGAHPGINDQSTFWYERSE